MRRLLTPTVLLVALSALHFGGAAAQETGVAAQQEAGLPSAVGATPLLPMDHWARATLQRLDAAGLLAPGRDPGSATWTLGDVASALDEARGLAGPGAEWAASLARESLVRMRAELGTSGEEGAEPLRTPRRLPGWVEVGGRWRGGALTAAYDTAVVGPPVVPRPIASEREAEVGGLLALQVLPWLAAEARASAGGEGVRLLGGSALVHAGPLRLWGGRRSVRYGPTPVTPGLLLGGGTALDGGGVGLSRGLLLPGLLSWLGPLNAETLVARMEGAGETERPWLWAFRASLRPHPRLRLSVERTALIGGEGNEASARDVLDLLVGRHEEDGAVANQILAAAVRFRPPVGSLPLALYGSLGIDDSAGAWHDVPALMAGAEVPAFPGIPWLGAAVEGVYFDESCCGNPPWYRHLKLPWTEEGGLLGHPLGGNGSEWRVRLHAHAPARGLWTDLTLFTRDRDAENLFAPDRVGRSTGAEASLRLADLWSGGEIRASGMVERGDPSWRHTRFSVAGRQWF